MFSLKYLSEVESIIIPNSRHVGRYTSRGTQGLNVISMHMDIVLQEHLYILNNIDEFEPYLSTHKRVIKEKYPRMSEKWLLKDNNKNFISWFNERISNDDSASEKLNG